MIRFTDDSKPLDFFKGIKMSASTRRDDGTTTVTTRARQHTSAPVVAASHWLTAGREEGKRRAEEKEKDQTCCSASIPSLLQDSPHFSRTLLISEACLNFCLWDVLTTSVVTEVFAEHFSPVACFSMLFDHVFSSRCLRCHEDFVLLCFLMSLSMCFWKLQHVADPHLDGVIVSSIWPGSKLLKQLGRSRKLPCSQTHWPYPW